MNVEQSIQKKIIESVSPDYLEVINESHNHNVPENSETHFKVVAVTEQFEGLARVRRHQLLYQILSEELQGGVHALSLHLFTPLEWQERQKQTATSPLCMGGS
ncbi:BolA family protein [Marinibactrum halimedae]|uniref:Transcriptional regulator n=1 Tax=Marinibactrum halimedae TaxID=1444977 RepID=A0AA37T5C2_9GAMM|nr:BolA/IbaG family iron-sulfur metabolism protein [Marinibactrum halimedae]MCD9458645.1 BolA/IbaG family iron-sulfur metabolism protein [Marinibactrum halimedae]GLS25989.1 transcriptional regulator [Marinibactrum halimedae]